MNKINYEKKYKEQLIKNLENFDIEDKKSLNKIKNFCKKFNFDENEVKILIKQKIFFKAWFILKPSKQNFYEKVFSDFLKEEINGTLDVYRPKKNIFIVDQQIVDKKQRESYNEKLRGKSVDFTFKYKDLKIIFYVFHKYTKECGGAQDNQKNDVKISINAARTNTTYNKNIMVLFVCDGDYYNEPKIEELKKMTIQANLVVLRSNEIQKFLNKIYLKKQKMI